jgi:GT2 family glycosyltransferase
MHAHLVAVVIPSWNAAEHLERCLESLAPTRHLAEVVVVDNASTDRTPEVVSAHAATYVPLDRNRGFGTAVNVGVTRTEAPSVFVLNADTVVESGCLERLVAALETDGRLGGVQPRILVKGSAPPRLYSAGQRLLSDGRAIEEGAGTPDELSPVAPHEIWGVCGAACLLRRELFDAMGGYDERYFAFYEDVDLNARARILGWSFRYVPDAVVWHVGAGVWRELPKPAGFNARLVSRNRLATALKVIPGRYAGRVAYAELASLALSVSRGTLPATLWGKISVLRWLPALVRERRNLRRSAHPGALEHWFEEEGSWLAHWALARVTPTADPSRSP